MKNQKVEKHKKIYWAWFLPCILFTLLTLWHQYLYYLFLLAPPLPLAVPVILEISRLLSIGKYFRHRTWLAGVAYIMVAFLAISVNLKQFDREVKEIAAENLESFGKFWQNLANKRVAQITKEVQGQRDHLKQNEGILKANPNNKRIQGYSDYELADIDRLLKEKSDLFKNKPKTVVEYALKIPLLIAECQANRDNSTQYDESHGGNGENLPAAKLEEYNPGEHFALLAFLAFLMEFMILMTGRAAFPRLPKPGQKNPKDSKKNGKDSKKMFTEFMQHESCQKYLAACKDLENFKDRDKYGLPRPGIPGVSKKDSQGDGVVVRFRNLLRDNKKFLEVSNEKN